MSLASEPRNNLNKALDAAREIAGRFLLSKAVEDGNISKDWDEDKHPRASDGKFGASIPTMQEIRDRASKLPKFKTGDKVFAAGKNRIVTRHDDPAIVHTVTEDNKIPTWHFRENVTSKSEASGDFMKANFSASTVADSLKEILRSTYSLYLKTHHFHWNVTGPVFQELHETFGEQYEALIDDVDALAERIRALGFPVTNGDIDEVQTGEDMGEEAMLKSLLAEYESLIEQIRKAVATRDISLDQATLNLLADQLQAHEKTAWMIRASLDKTAKMVKADFDSDKHPRSDDGKFTSGGGEESSSASNESGSPVQNAETHAAKIKSDVKAPYVKAVVSTLGGPDRPSVMITVAMDPKESWSNGILENSTYAKLHLDHTGKLEQFSGFGLKIRGKTFEDASKAPDYINSQIASWKAKYDKGTLKSESASDLNKEYDEDKHPRGADGKFTSGGGGELPSSAPKEERIDPGSGGVDAEQAASRWRAGDERTAGERGRMHQSIRENHADAWFEVLNGGFSQLWNNKGDEGGPYMAAETARMLSAHGFKETAALFQSAANIMREYESSDERTDDLLNRLDTQVYRSSEYKNIGQQFDDYYDAHREKSTGTGDISKYIRHEGSKWTVYSEAGKPMGTYDSEAGAKKRLQQIEYFKHVNKAVDAARDAVTHKGVPFDEAALRWQTAISSPPVKDPANLQQKPEEPAMRNENANMPSEVSPIITGLKGNKKQPIRFSGDTSTSTSNGGGGFDQGSS